MNGQILNARVFSHMGFKWVLSVALLLKCIYTYTTYAPFFNVYQVRWDEDIGTDHQERVSPWEIDPSVSLPPLSIQSSPRLKKLRTSLQAFPPNHSIPGTLLFNITAKAFSNFSFPICVLRI